MDMQEQLREAILEEFNRQAENGALRIGPSDDAASVTVDGRLNLDDLIMVIAGSMAGGP